MERVGIWERDEGIAQTVKTGLLAVGAQVPELVTGRHPAALAEGKLDLLVISPGAQGWAGMSAIASPIVLLPGLAGPLARQLQAGSAVSYGPSPKDTITLSSLEGDQICVAVQRELVTVAGTVVERQELVLPFPVGLPPQPWLAAVGALLLLDVSPERLQTMG